MTDIKDELNDIKDDPTVEPEKDNGKDIKDEPTDIVDEQPKAIEDKSLLGQIRKVESMIKAKEEVPKDLMWVMQHVNVDAIKPSEPEDDDFDKRYEKRRDSERFDEALELLEDELDETDIANIKKEIDELKSEHPTMTSMKAYELVMRPVVVSDKVRRKTRLRSQAIIPGGSVEKPDADAKAYKQYCDDLRQVGLTPTRDKFNNAKEQGIL